MFSYTELRGQSNLLHKSGSVEINTEYDAARKPAWLVLLKLLGVAAMVAVGFAIALPTFLELNFPLWQGAAITAGGMLIYTGLAFFLRPEPNTDNMGIAGGLVNDPFQYSDDVNRMLWKAHCLLGPGRFTAETLLDLCALLGIVRGASAESHAGEAHGSGGIGHVPPGSFDATRPIAPLDPNRFAQTSANYVAGQIQLETQRFLTPKQPS